MLEILCPIMTYFVRLIGTQTHSIIRRLAILSLKITQCECSVIDDINPTFKGGDAKLFLQQKSPLKEQTVKVYQSKLESEEDEGEAEGEESEDSEFNEDEDMCDEDEEYMRKRKRELKNKDKDKKTNKKSKQNDTKQSKKVDRKTKNKKKSESEHSSNEEEEDDEDSGEGENQESEGEGESEESEEIKFEPRNLPQRQSRGKRMNLLVGKALEEDEEFWGQDFFQENDDDESFDAASSEAKDSFDSDFDKSEHSNDAEGDEEEDEKQARRQERAKKKKVKFFIPPKKKAAKKESPIQKKAEKISAHSDEVSENTSEPVPVARKSKRMQARRELEESDGEEEFVNTKPEINEKNIADRKRELKEKNKAFLESHGIFGDVQSKWVEILSKDKLTPIEKVQEAALTEIINKESLSYLQELENERVNEMVYRDRRPKGPSVKIIQDIKPGHFNSRMVFPSSDFYPKNFNTKKEKQKESQRYQMNTCMITGKKAKYKDPLTLTPFANKDAFKVVRERFFQKEEDKLNMRIHIINELLNQKRAKLKRFQNFDMIADPTKPETIPQLAQLPSDNNVQIAEEEQPI